MADVATLRDFWAMSAVVLSRADDGDGFLYWFRPLLEFGGGRR